MLNIAQALASVPAGLRDPLFAEYQRIVGSFLERRWLPTELSGGRFCEIVYTILDGRAKGVYPHAPNKPANFVQACRQLENNASVPRSFQILIPRLLPTLYEIRNNRGVGHVGGDIDPNHMDAAAVVAMTNWIMAELVRVFHSLPVDEAQVAVDLLAERRLPIVWQQGDMKRVLQPSLVMKDQVLLLLGTSAGNVTVADLLRWTDAANKSYFMGLLRTMHKERLIELSSDDSCAQILPPGSKYVECDLILKLQWPERGHP